MKEKIKCKRCRDIMAIETSIRNIISAINSMRAKGMRTHHLDDGLLMMESKKRDMEAMECSCFLAEQMDLADFMVNDPRSVIRG